MWVDRFRDHATRLRYTNSLDWHPFCPIPAKGKPGVRLAGEITFPTERRHLPVVKLKRAT